MKTLNKTLIYSVLAALGIGFFITVVASVFINGKVNREIRLKNVESIHRSITEMLKSSVAISDFGEVQRALGLLSSDQRKFGVYMRSGDWILPDYGTLPKFEEKIKTFRNKASCREFGSESDDWFCSELQEGAILISIENQKSTYMDLIKPNIWVIIVSILPMAIVGFFGARFLRSTILKPFYKIHSELTNLKTQNVAGGNVRLAGNREFEELSNIANAVNDLLTEIRLANSEVQKREKAVLIAQLATQVVHDIRSPLVALQTVLSIVDNMPEEMRLLIRGSVNRINDIANQLLQKGNASQSLYSVDLKPHLLAPLIDAIVSEKRIMYRERQGIDIEADISNSYGLFAKVNPLELKRVISNLINNSVEALINGQGKIVVGISGNERNITVTIRDNGKGISEALSRRLGEYGLSVGKEGTTSGSGLGIYHARRTIEGFFGTFKISSKESAGTTITILLPRAQSPAWFVEKIRLSPNCLIVSVDDDQSIHGVWKQRFQTLIPSKFGLTHITFTSGEEFKKWCLKQKKTSPNSDSKRIFLIDYELLGQQQTGLDIIEALGISQNSILVTSRFEEDNVIARCERLEVKLIPKPMAQFIQIEMNRPTT